MRIERSIAEPIRPECSWEAAWKGTDKGLIACWERGREKAREDPELASRACDGQLVVLPCKRGFEKATKKGEKCGPLYYLAMWQGLRGEDLNIDLEIEVTLRCRATQMTAILTNDVAKYGNSGVTDADE